MGEGGKSCGLVGAKARSTRTAVPLHGAAPCPRVLACLPWVHSAWARCFSVLGVGPRTLTAPLPTLVWGPGSQEGECCGKLTAWRAPCSVSLFDRGRFFVPTTIVT